MMLAAGDAAAGLLSVQSRVQHDGRTGFVRRHPGLRLVHPVAPPSTGTAGERVGDHRQARHPHARRGRSQGGRR